MNVAVYCGANFGKGERYRQAAKAMGHWIAENGHTLVYGGSNTGLMGILADTVLSAGGKAIGIIPEFLLEHEQPHQDLTELFFCAGHVPKKKENGIFGRGIHCLARWSRNTGRNYRGDFLVTNRSKSLSVCVVES